MTADEVITLRKQDNKSDDMHVKHRFESLFLQFLTKGKNEGYTNGTLQSIYASVRSFFEIHYYPLQMRKKDYPKSVADGVKRATKEAVLEIIAENNISLTAKVLTANDTGLGVSDLRRLNCDVILDNPNDDFIHIHTKRQKTGDIVDTFLGHDAITALKNYLELRRKGTDKVAPETITRESPLFVTKKETRASRENISTIMKNAFRRHGYKRMSAHSLRKKLQTDLEKGGMNPNWIDQILGHQLINSRGAYSLPTIEELKEAYQNAYDHIRVTPKEITQNQLRIPTATTNTGHETTPEVVEAKTIEEVRKLYQLGYKFDMEMDGIKFFRKT
jgi:site-specific recombinase XerD